MKINGYTLPKELMKFFVTTFLMYLIGLFLFVPLIIYVINPLLNWVLHGVTFSVSQAKALSFEKLSYFVLFASFWISFILWIRELVSWYQRVSKPKKS